MTYNLRPLHERLANGVAETKGYNGAALNPWRTAKKMTRPGQREAGKVEVIEGVMVWTKTPGQAKRQAVKVQKRNGEWSYPEIGGSTNAKGLPAASKRVTDSECGTSEMEEKCPGADYQPNMIYRPETREWVDMKPNTKEIETVMCDRYPVAKPSQDLRRKARPEGVGNTDTQWVGQLKTPVTPQAKPVAYDNNQKTYEIGVAYWYEVERVEGFEPATTKERDAALAEQVQAHGKTYRARHAKQCRTWEKKQLSWKQLTNVAQGTSKWVSLDDRPDGMEGDEPVWTPTTADRMSELAEAAAAYEKQELMRRILARMTDKQREAIELKAVGKPLTSSQRDNLQLARKKASLKG